MDARLNITYAGSNGDLVDMVNFDASDADIRAWASEAIQSGSVPGITATANPNLAGFMIDRFPATDVRPYPLIQLRPKTEFGG
jgi:hypothetical protein